MRPAAMPMSTRSPGGRSASCARRMIRSMSPSGPRPLFRGHHGVVAIRRRPFGALAQAPLVLRRPEVPGRIAFELERGAERPLRIEQQLAPEADEVGLLALEDALGVTRVDDEADGRGHHAELAPD